ncbi:MAG: hypothetical protein COV46_01150 [Deltaproteobacteria bacterium CG11_big_fil_rev_8_21_14_0_20_49_13]|nr:MAG: hypothetical protein COV46_01150 [Deltaproteobacteria bacterium CG11_big_fil_rev_8_21_14_0_20_49_13]
MEIHLLPDKTSFIQLGTFLAVLVALKFLIFNPLIKIIKARKDRTEKLLAEAKALESRIREASLEYNEGLTKAKDEASKKADKIKALGLKEEAAIKAKAREESMGLINAAREKIEATKNKAMVDLRKDIPLIAEEIIKKING